MITILASRLAAGVVNFDSSDDVVISAAVPGAPVSSTRAILRVVRGPGVYGIVNVPFQVTLEGSSSSDAVKHITPSSGVVTILDRQVSTIANHIPIVLYFSLIQRSYHPHLQVAVPRYQADECSVISDVSCCPLHFAGSQTSCQESHNQFGDCSFATPGPKSCNSFLHAVSNLALVSVNSDNRLNISL